MRTDSLLIPQVKIGGVSVDVKIEHRHEIRRARVSNIAQWVLRELTSGSTAVRGDAFVYSTTAEQEQCVKQHSVQSQQGWGTICAERVVPAGFSTHSFLVDKRFVFPACRNHIVFSHGSVHFRITGVIWSNLCRVHLRPCLTTLCTLFGTCPQHFALPFYSFAADDLSIRPLLLNLTDQL
jgi:hypothetical protein